MQSTKNMEVTTQLQSEQHISKELAARLGHQEEELKEIREQVGTANTCPLKVIEMLKNKVN